MTQPTTHRPYHHGNLRAALLDTAERHLREYGADQLSLRDVTRELGVSHGAPRRHFPGRQALLDALAEAGFLRLNDTLSVSLAQAEGGYPERVRSAASAFVRFATENAALLELMNSSRDRPGATRITDAAEAAYRHMTELMADGQAHGYLEPGDPERNATILCATLQGICTMANANRIAWDELHSVVATAIEQFLRGARPSAS